MPTPALLTFLISAVLILSWYLRYLYLLLANLRLDGVMNENKIYGKKETGREVRKER